MRVSMEPKRGNREWRSAFDWYRSHRFLAVSIGLAGILLFGGAFPVVGADVLPVDQFYQNYCANCHGVHGSNPSLAKVFPDLPDFTNPDWEATHTKAELTESILHGKGAMPAYQGDLRGHTPAELIDYLRSLSGKQQTGKSKAASPSDPKSTPPADPRPSRAADSKAALPTDPPAPASADPAPPNGSPMPVAQFFKRYCANCHGANGSNPKLARIFPDLPDFSRPDWESTHTKVELTESILNGKGAMPAYRGDLRGHTPQELIDYLRGLSRHSKNPS